ADALRERKRRLARRDAAAAHAHLDLDVDVELRAARRERRHAVRMVDADTDLRTLRERGKAGDLGGADHFVAHQHIADRADRDLALGDLRAFVRLGVGAHAHAATLHRVGHGAQVALEGVELDNQRGSIDLLEVLPDGGRGADHARAGRRCRDANQTSAIVTIATSTSAKRFTRAQPAVVMVAPEVNEDTSMTRKMTWSFAPCAFARSSGR